MGCPKLHILKTDEPLFKVTRKIDVTQKTRVVDFEEYENLGVSYYPFGMLQPNRHGGESYTYGMNGMEQDNEVKGKGNSYTTLFRQYDPRLGRWSSLDPMESSFPFSSPYVAFNNNPILYVDPMGDSSVIDNKGYMVYYDAKDLRVFMQGTDGTLTKIGKLGGKIDASGWFDNLLVENSNYALGNLIYPLGEFNSLVKQDGAWDYKNRSPDNQSSVKNSPYHILGIAFFRGDKNSRSGKGGDLDKTTFVFQGKEARPEDLNNLHFGAVFKGLGVVPESVMRWQVGNIEQAKWDNVEKRNALREQGVYWWDENPNDELNIGKWIGKEKEWVNPNRKKWGKYSGDNPTDYEFVGDGIKYYNNTASKKIIEKYSK